jgi:O-antigen/teichoic acid export membrane protein
MTVSNDQQRLTDRTVHLGTQTLAIALGTAFTLCVGLPLQIYVARVLGAADLGIFSLLEALTNWIAGLLSFGVAPTVVRFIPQHLEKDEFQAIERMLRRGAIVLAVASVAGYVAILALIPLASPWWPELSRYAGVTAVMGLLTPLGLFLFFFQQGLRGFQEIRYLVIGSSLLQLTAKAVLTVALLAAGFGLFGYAAAVVASTAFAVLYMYVGLRNKIAGLPRGTEPPSKAQTVAWRSYARTMYGSSLLGLTAVRLDRFVLGFLFGPSPVGVWSVVTQLYVLPNVILNMFIMAAVPMFSAAQARNDGAERQHIFHLVTDWSVRAGLPLILFFLIFGDLLLRMYGPDFAASGTYALWLLTGAQFANLVFGPLGYMLNMTGYEKLVLRFSAAQAMLTLAGFVILVPLFGLNGTAVTVAAAIVFLNAAEFTVARQKLGLKWWSSRYAKWLLPAIVAGASLLALREFAPMWHAALELAGAFLLVNFIFHLVSLMQGLNHDDRALILHTRDRLGLAKSVAP